MLLIAAVPAAAAGGRIAVLPWRTASTATQYGWLGDGPHILVGRLLATQAGWEPLSREDTARVSAAWGPADAPPGPEAVKILAADGVDAAIVCSAEEQAGTLRVQGDLYRNVAGAGAPLHFSYAGKTNQVITIAMLIAEVAGEALGQRFSRVLRPPLPSPPDFLLSRLEPSFGARNQQENLEQTEAFMLTALKIDPNNADVYFQLGSLYARNNLLDKSLAHLKSAVELNPKSARYHWGLGVTYSLQGLLEDALTEFLQSTVIDENYTEGFIALSALHRRLGDQEASQAAIERAAKARPGDPLVLTALGVNAYLARDPAAARERFEAARAADPRAVAASVNLALLQWEEGNVEGARKDLERALTVEPSNPEALMNMAIVDQARGAYSQAAERLNLALAAGAPKRAALFNLGTLQLQAGRLAEATQTLQSVLEIDPQHAPARNNLGLILLLRGQFEQTLSTLAGAERDDSPSGALLAYNLAFLHQIQRRSQQALVHYLRALQLRRDFTLAHINLGILFETMDRPEKALTEYLKALSSVELHPEVYTWLGQIYAQRGYGSMTEDTIRKTTLVDPSQPLAWHALATGYETLDKRKAVVAWRQFLDVVRRDRNRAFWVPVAEQHLAAIGSPQ
ncbi:MAG: tetratricopeptide repeat protein [Candidatus Methylomirabilia bacterium]